MSRRAPALLRPGSFIYMHHVRDASVVLNTVRMLKSLVLVNQLTTSCGVEFYLTLIVLFKNYCNLRGWFLDY